MKIISYVQSNNGKINSNSLEAFVAAQKICDKVNGEVYMLTFDESAANELTKYESNGIILLNNDHLKEYNPLYYLKSLEKVYEQHNPDFMIFGHTYQTRDWVPRLSARMNISFISDCINFDDSLCLIRPIYQAKLNEKIKLNSSGIISYQSGSFSLDNIKTGSSTIEKIDIDLNEVELTIRPGEKFKESSDDVDLNTSEIIVSIGRGIGKEENIPVAEKLAEKLNAQIGASRPVVDSGWIDHSRQVGSSGQTVSPKLYLSLGISGAIQHLVGMKGSKNIIAINKDPNAPIFEIADYAVVGDLFEILPKLTDQL